MKKQILNLAKNVINAKLNNKQIPSKSHISDKHPKFLEKKATFVTLKIDGHLRGCIGSLIAYRDLYDDLVSNANSAAFKDPRFMPLTLKEFKKTSIEISLLSEPIRVKYGDYNDLKSKIKVLLSSSNTCVPTGTLRYKFSPPLPV